MTFSNVNDAPVVTTSGGSVQYNENAAPIVIDSGLTITDIDSAALTGAAVRITVAYVNGQDVLSFTNQLGISGSWSAATGTLTLSGTTTAANYQTALRSITYHNTSEDPSIAVRTVAFDVNDGAVESALQQRGRCKSFPGTMTQRRTTRRPVAARTRRRSL